MSEEFDTPVLLRLTTRLSHSDGLVSVGERQEVPLRGEFEPDPPKYVMVPAHARVRRQVMAERTARLAEFAEKTDLNRKEPGDTAIGIISSGVVYEHAREVFPDASFLKLGLVWPLPQERLRKFADSVFASQVDKVVVVEELDPFLAEQIRAMGIRVEPMDGSFGIGELTPGRVRAMITGEAPPQVAPDEDLPPRPPVLCAGCPHRGVFTVLRKLKVYVTGDIGCYTLGALPPLGALHTCLCMGAGVGQVHGMQKVRGHLRALGHHRPGEHRMQQRREHRGHTRQRYHGHDRRPGAPGRRRDALRRAGPAA